MNINLKLFTISLTSALVLTGCGGGGGGGGGGSSFTSWSTITKPSEVTLDGISTDASYTASSKIDTITDNGVDLTTTASITHRANDTISKISVSTNNVNVTFDEDGVDTIDDSFTTVVYGYNQAGTDFFVAAKPIGLNWDYQTFGIWETGRGTGSGTAGGISIGAATTGSNIPTSGSATYSGYYAGMISDYDGDDFLSRGNINVAADFANRSLSYSTSSSDYISPVTATPTWIADSNQDMSGTLTYSSATNSFTGTLTDGYGWSGTGTGKFYGPNAEELGGVFNISGSGLNMHAGAFGAKK